MKRHDKVLIKSLNIKGTILERQRNLCIIDTQADGQLIIDISDLEKVNPLKDEYLTLKAKLFGGSMFVVLEDTQEQKRYDQLLAYFYPQFRTKNWINPSK